MNSKKSKEVIGGSRVGAGAWGLARVDTVVELPPEEEEWKLNEGRRKKVRDAEQS